MKKEIGVVMIATEDNSNIQYNKTLNKYLYCETPVRTRLSQHLYFTSDEKIKNGDLVIFDKQIGKIIVSSSEGYLVIWGKDFNVNVGDHDYDTLKRRWRKIIATTDRSLKIISTCCEGSGYDGRKQCTNCEGKGTELLPNISQDFIKEFVKNPVDKVMVDFNDSCDVKSGDYQCHSLKPKLDLNNCVVTSPIKNSWGRDELIGNQNGSLDQFLLNSKDYTQEEREVIMQAIVNYTS